VQSKYKSSGRPPISCKIGHPLRHSKPKASPKSPRRRFVNQYNIIVDPNRFRSLNIPLWAKVRGFGPRQQHGAGGAPLSSLIPFVVRGRGYVKASPTFRVLLLKSRQGTPVFAKDVARIELGPTSAEESPSLTGRARSPAIALHNDTSGQNALECIDNVKARLADMRSALPKGVEILSVLTVQT